MDELVIGAVAPNPNATGRSVDIDARAPTERWP